MNFITIEAREALADLDDARLPIPIRRTVAADLVAALIDYLDDTEGDPDLEPYLADNDWVPGGDDREADEDFEATTGGGTSGNRLGLTLCEDDEPSFGFDALEGGDVLDQPHDGGDDDEPSIGWSEAEAKSGRYPGLSFESDREIDNADDEPSLGSPEIPPIMLVQGGRSGWFSRHGTQEHWADSGRTDGEEDGGDAPEQVNEDGGDVQDEPHDEEPDLEYSAGVDSGDAMTTEWTAKTPAEEVVRDHDFERITRHRDRRLARRHTPPAIGQRLFHGQVVSHLPERYIMGVVGDCLDPEIRDGQRLEFSTSDRPRGGDFVAIYRRAQFVRAGEWQIVVKRLVTDWRGGEVTPVIFRGGKTICLGECVEVEMLNPPRRLYYPAEQVEAMHKMIRIVPDDEHHPVLSAAELAAQGALTLAEREARS